MICGANAFFSSEVILNNVFKVLVWKFLLFIILFLPSLHLNLPVSLCGLSNDN